MARFLPILILFSLISCTLPTAQKNPDDFVSLREQKAILYLKLGDDFFLKGRYVAAELEYRKALYLFNDFENIRINLINVLIRQGLFDQAQEELEILLNKDPKNPDFLALKALLYSEKQEYNVAISYYFESLNNIDSLDLAQRNRYKELIYNNLSTIQFKLGLENEAIENAFNAYKVNKNYFQKARLAKLQIASGREEIFYDDLGELERLNNQKIEYIANHLIVLFLKNEFNLAKNLSSRIKETSGYSTSIMPQVELINYLLNDKRDIESGVNKIDEKTQEFLDNLHNNEQVKLYWPLGLLKEVGEISILIDQ